MKKKMTTNLCVISILKNNRFSVKTEYQSSLVQFYKTLQKYYWDNANKVWTFPDSEMNKVVEMMDSLALEKRIVDYMPSIQYYPNVVDDKVEIDVEWNRKLWSIFQRIDGYQWIKERQRCSIPRVAFAEFASLVSETFGVNTRDLHDNYDKAIAGFPFKQSEIITTPQMKKEPHEYASFGHKATRWSRVADEDIPSNQQGLKAYQTISDDKVLRRVNKDLSNLKRPRSPCSEDQQAYKSKCVR